MNESTYQRAISALTLVFVIICSIHFFLQRQIWLDEDMVFRSIKEYHLVQIFGPLKFSQAFPRVHLAAIKVFSTVFQYHVLALRFFSYIFMLSAFFLWVNIYKDQVSDKRNILLCVLAFVCAFKLSYYSAELKPYAMDVLAVAIYTYYLCSQRKFAEQNPSVKDVCFTLALPLLVFFSYATLFVIWIVGFNFLLLVTKNKNVLPLLLSYIAFAVICLVVFYHIDFKYSISPAAENYWESTFICSQSLACFFDSFGDGLKKLVTYWNGNSKIFIRAAVIFVPFYVFSLFRYGLRQWQNDKLCVFHLDTVGFVLFLELVILGLLHKYPFTGERVTLFYAPFAFYMVVRGIDSIKRFKSFYYIMVGYFVCYYMVCCVNTLRLHVGPHNY